MRFISIFIKKRVFFIDTITMSIWSGLPFLVILPFSIVLVKILVNYPNSIWLFSLLLVFLSVWVFMRILKSVSVVFDKNSTIVNIIGLATVIFFLGIPIFIYQNKYQFIDYINYLFKVIIGV
jgi:cbb3-type cytochrome oxidase subunit 3